MRTPLARKLALLMRRAQFLNQRPDLSVNQLSDQLASRRNFLKKSAIIPAGLILSGGFLEACACLCKKDSGTHSKVTILGGGMSGLVSAYYLTKAKIPCEIYESSERSGGRVFTKYNFNQENMYCELGGELVDSNNEDLIKLCREFLIEVEAFAAFDKGLESNLYFIENKYYTDRELLPAFQKFAKHLAAAKAAPVPSMDRLSLEEYLQGLEDVEPWLTQVIRVAYIGESGVEADEQSAYMMISTMDSDFSKGTKFFGDSDEALKIKGGNTRLTQAIEKYLIANGVEIHFDTPLIGIKETSQKIELQFQKDISNFTVRADRVICTIPFSRLRDVDGIANLGLSAKKKACIEQMRYGTNSKMMLGFQKPLWREPSHHHSNGMVYTDLFDQNLWETSRLQQGKSGILTSFTGGKNGRALSIDQVQAYLKSIDQVFPGLQKIHDSNSAMFNWSQYKHTKGSYSVLAPGQMTQFGDVAGLPELSGRLLFAGEHATKEFAGFVNGAAYSGRKAAEKVIAG